MRIKILSLIILASLLSTCTFAKGGSSQGQQNVSSSSRQGQDNSSPESNVSDKGDNQQIQVHTQQQTEDEEKGGTNSNLSEHASSVAKYVQNLLNSTNLSGGIGDQVREIARTQNQSQEKIKKQINNIENKNKFLKFLFGTNYDALRTMQQEMEQNQERVRTLLQLKDQVVGFAEKQDIQGLIDSLNNQNVTLQDKITNELGKFSLLGWFSKLFK